MSHPKAYITCPVSHTRERLNLLPVIKEIVEANGITPFVFEIGGTPREIFDRDYAEIKSSDIIIAEVSERSHGVGIEIGMAFCNNLKIILLIENGNSVTKLAQGIPGIVLIEYSNIDDLKQKLSHQLKNS